MKSIRLSLTGLVLGLGLLLVSCAGGFRSAREFQAKKPPYYHGKLKQSVQVPQVAYLPVEPDQRTSTHESRQILSTLCQAMTAYFENQYQGIRMNPVSFSETEGPDIFLGHPGMFDSPVMSERNEKDDDPGMVLYQLDPSSAWKTEIVGQCQEKGAQYILRITLGITEFLPRQTSLLGKKEIALGTGYSVPVKWLTSLEDGVETLVLCGALLDSNGKIIRSGAEGILAAGTANLLESALGIQNVITEDVLRRTLTDISREDLEGKPLAYQVALQNLIAGLLMREDWVKQ